MTICSMMRATNEGPTLLKKKQRQDKKCFKPLFKHRYM